jgi:hypothetical protein
MTTKSREFNPAADNGIKDIHDRMARNSIPRTYPRLTQNNVSDVKFVVMNITTSIFKGKLGAVAIEDSPLNYCCCKLILVFLWS